ncbi:MAG: CBS domain-containing protein [Bacteroidales bacterium]|nr:CBS domain-containing protein [Bacteroidales bacterium]
MFRDNTDITTFASLLSTDNIVLFEKTSGVADIFAELLKNLALTYGIGNVKQILSGAPGNNNHGLPKPLNGCALLQHFRLTTTDHTRIAIGIVREGIEYNTGKTKTKIHFFFLLATPRGRPDLYLRVLKTIVGFTGDSAFVDFALKEATPEAIYKLLEKTGENIPGYVLVSDIMQKPEHLIREGHNLKEAVDMFTRTGSLFIPVVDKDGDLIGEVTLQELMRVCLPRYILWMDDFQPILNFEPFRNMLFNEDNTWLEEIMIYDIVKVHAGDPAIKAGVGMTKLSVDHAYVLEDKKLAGIVTLQQFVYKVLRE